MRFLIARASYSTQQPHLFITSRSEKLTLDGGMTLLSCRAMPGARDGAPFGGDAGKSCPRTSFILKTPPSNGVPAAKDGSS